MRVVVTGGSGQLGTLVIQRLLDDPGVSSVLSLDVRPSSIAHDKLAFAHADVRDRAALEQHFAGANALFHLAAVVFSRQPRATLDAINVTGSRNAFEAAAAAGITRVVYASSAAAYGVVPGHKLPVTEDAPRVYQDDFAYAAGKHAVEAFLDAFEPAHPGMSIARLRPVLLVGAHMDHPLGLALRHRILPRVSRALFAVVDDEDVADAALLAFRAGARGAFNLSADEPLTFAELARRTGLRSLYFSRPLAERLGPVFERLGLGSQDPTWLRVAEVNLVVSSERAQRVLGWSRRCPTSVSVIERFLATTPQPDMGAQIAQAIRRRFAPHA